MNILSKCSLFQILGLWCGLFTYTCNLHCIYIFSVTKKVAAYLGDVLEDQKDKLQENLLANGSRSQ